MSKFYYAAIATATLAVLCLSTFVAGVLLHWPIDHGTVLLAAIGIAVCATCLGCTYAGIKAIRRTAGEVRSAVAEETRALHRSMVVAMEQYGDGRAIDAVVSSERRRTVNERAQQTVDLGNTGNASNVTRLHKRP